MADGVEWAWRLSPVTEARRHLDPADPSFFALHVVVVVLRQAVGVKVRRWVTMHGVALNVDPDMDYFKHIVPCGIGHRPVAAGECSWE